MDEGLSEDELDGYLREALKYQRDTSVSDSGIVVAGIIDPGKDEVLYAGSLDGGEKIVHAERNAAEQFVDEYGQPSDRACMVTSLSPCTRYDELNEMRKGDSCTDLILGNDNVFDNGIERVHTGFMDPWQADMDEYDELGLDLTVTDDPELYECCENLFDYFRLSETEMRETDIAGFVDDKLARLD